LGSKGLGGRAAQGKLKYGSLQFERQTCNDRIQQRKRSAGMLVTDVLAELEFRRAVEALNHHTVDAIRHNAQQLTVLAEDEVTAGWIKFPEQALQDIAVQFHIPGSRDVDLKLAFTIVSFVRSHQDCILEFERISRHVVQLAA